MKFIPSYIINILNNIYLLIIYNKMSILLKLDSTLAGQPSEDFTIKFTPPIKINGPYELGLLKLNMWYSWYNISSAKNNNTFRYYNGAVFRPIITIGDGQYTLDLLNKLLHDEMRNNGDFTIDAFGNEVFDIIITPNYATLRTNITLTNGYQLDLSLSNLYLLLGCEQTLLTFSGSTDCTNVANLNDDINNLVVHCSIISGNASYANSNKNNVIYSFVPSTAPGTNIDIDPITKVYLPIDVIGGQIEEIRMQILDNLDRVILLNDEPVTYLLHLKQAKRIE